MPLIQHLASICLVLCHEGKGLSQLRLWIAPGSLPFLITLVEGRRMQVTKWKAIGKECKFQCEFRVKYNGSPLTVLPSCGSQVETEDQCQGSDGSLLKSTFPEI